MEQAESQSSSGAAGGGSCLLRIVGVILLTTSLVTGVWNLVSQSPWQEHTSRPASAAEVQIPHTAVNPYSVNTFVSQEVEPWKREKTVEMISMAGIGWIKEGFPWSEIEPSEGSFWDPEFQQDSWEKYDEIVELAEQFGIRIIARLDHTPPWARGEDTDYHHPPEDVEDFGQFVEKFVERYSGRIQHIQVWNEPNLAREWGDDIDPDGYFELLREAYIRAKAADPDVVLLSAPMAMTNERSGRAMPELDYWERLYELGAADYFDVMTATGYGIDQPPEEEPREDVINLRRIEFLRSMMEDNGDTDKPIWLTEYGWNSAPESIAEERLEWGQVTPGQQAEWTTRGVEFMSENWDWFGVSSIWYFRQVGLIPPDAAEYYFAMVDLEFTPREVYLNVRSNALERRVALPGEYGPMESPLQQTGQWHRFDDPEAPFGETIASETWGSEMRIEFSGTDLTIYPGDLNTVGGWLYVTLNGEPAQEHLFSHDHLERTYIDLDELPPGTEEITLVDEFGTNQPQQENVFVMHIHEGAKFSVRGIEVDYQRAYGQFAMISLLTLVGTGVGLVLIRRRPD